MVLADMQTAFTSDWEQAQRHHIRVHLLRNLCITLLVGEQLPVSTTSFPEPVLRHKRNVNLGAQLL
jgi:hypothetical protein